jgi:glycosidase
VELAIRRILLIHGVILTVGGIPLIYLGDEIGTLNDYTYRDDPAHASDSRWVHRPRADWNIPLRVAEQYALTRKRLLYGECEFIAHEGMNLPPLELAVLG